jgi:hypothetical protein
MVMAVAGCKVEYTRVSIANAGVCQAVNSSCPASATIPYITIRLKFSGCGTLLAEAVFVVLH